jgi:two-component system cell cycle sensor histidine kinase/response regulator CckA
MTDSPEQPASPCDNFYRLLCEQAPVAMIATDAALNILHCNSAAAELVGLAKDVLMGRPVLEVVPPERRRVMARLLERTLRRRERSEFEVRLPGHADRSRHLLVVLSPVPGEGGAGPAGVAAWIVDETHRKQLAERLIRAEKMASLGTLAGGVAHHFNNILGGVATFVDYALTSNDPAAMRRALQMAAEASTRASRITQSLLTFAEGDHRRQDLADLTEIILTFAHLIERPLEQKKILLRLDLHPIPVVPVESNRMHQVLGNLLTNSEEAMLDGGTVTLATAATDTEVMLTFSDTGCGIPPEHQPLVFEPFFTTKGLLAGGDKANPGLGLSIVHGLVQGMGGRIELLSAPGQGASFTIVFPRPADE